MSFKSEGMREGTAKKEDAKQIGIKQGRFSQRIGEIKEMMKEISGGIK
jgi:hypothetical protein